MLMIAIVLWVSAIASALWTTSPLLPAMVLVIRSLAAAIGRGPSVLRLDAGYGTDIGGSATPIGASANVVGISVAAKGRTYDDWLGKIL